jgi:hypothetical protein
VTVSSAVSAGWNGSGTIVISFTLDQDAVDALAGLGIDPFGAAVTEASSTSATGPPQVAPRPFDDLEEAGWETRRAATPEGDSISFRHEFEGPEQLSALAAQVSGDVEPPLFPKMALTVDAGVLRSDLSLDAVVNPTPELIVALAGRGLDAPPSLAELERALGAPIAETIKFVFSVSLAGAEVYTTDPAGSVQVHPGTWEVPIGSSLKVSASSGTWTPAFWVAIVSAGVALVLALALYLMALLSR